MPETNTLSDREKEILQLVATGLTNREIAQSLTISPNTVKVHLRNIFEKIEVSSRTEATLYGIENGLVEVPGSEESLNQPSSLNMIQNSPWILLAILLIVIFILTLSNNVLFQRSTPTPLALSNLPDRWQELSSMPEPRSNMAAVTYNSNVYVISGEGPQGVSRKVFRYVTSKDQWEHLSDKPTPVSEVKGVLVGEEIYIPGGRLGDGSNSDVLEVYDPRRDTWEQRASLPIGICGYAITDFEGEIYLFGGWDGEKVLDIVLRYDPIEDRWGFMTPMPTARAYADAVSAGGKIYVIGGWDSVEKLNIIQSYLPSRDRANENAWEQMESFSEDFNIYSAHSLSELIFVIGKQGIYYYSLQNETWHFYALDSKIQLYADNAVSSVEGNFYILGGKDENGIHYSDNIRYQAIYTIAIPQIIN